jgi:serine/threonine protein phosphatase PrpC
MAGSGKNTSSGNAVPLLGGSFLASTLPNGSGHADVMKGTNNRSSPASRRGMATTTATGGGNLHGRQNSQSPLNNGGAGGAAMTLARRNNAGGGGGRHVGGGNSNSNNSPSRAWESGGGGLRGRQSPSSTLTTATTAKNNKSNSPSSSARTNACTTPTQRHDGSSIVTAKHKNDLYSSENTTRRMLEDAMAPSAMGVSAVQGGRAYMEDEYCVVFNMEKNLKLVDLSNSSPASSPTPFVDNDSGDQNDCPTTHFFGVFDGHAGKRCSKAVAQSLAGNVRRDAHFRGDLRKAATRGCAKSNGDFMKQAARYRMDDGSTGIVALVRDSLILMANVGDSRGMLVSKKKGIALSVDHKPNRPDERRRVIAAGGRVTNSYGVPRVNGILAVSRAFGDRGVTGVIAEPEIQEHRLSLGDDFLVLASDGLWDVLAVQECADLVQRHFQRGTPQSCAEMLTERALRKGSMDNITALVVDLRPYVAALSTGNK